MNKISHYIKRVFKVIGYFIVTILVLCTIVSVSFFTPVFSTVGLWVLNKLPIPEVNHTRITIINSFNYTPLTPAIDAKDKVEVNEDNKDSQPSNNPKSNTYPLELLFHHKPTAYVVLGGGLTEASDFDDILSQDKYLEDSGIGEELSNSVDAQTPNSPLGNSYSDTLNNSLSDSPNRPLPKAYYPLAANTIILNKYSLTRMTTVLKHYKVKPLPIVLTGVESPWMQDWLNHHGIKDIVSENASMNTCENARFTAKRLHLADVYLITDAYHMTRTRRQFALNNIHTTPIVAPLPMQKGWLHPKNNAQHSRRTLYELAAYTRDVFFPQQNCRLANEVSFDTLLKSRKEE